MPYDSKVSRSQYECLPPSPSLSHSHFHTLIVNVFHSLFGDEQEVAFWTVALYYILREKNRRLDPRYKVSYSCQPPYLTASLPDCTATCPLTYHLAS